MNENKKNAELKIRKAMRETVVTKARQGIPSKRGAKYKTKV